VVDRTPVTAPLKATNHATGLGSMTLRANAPAANRVETTDENGIPLRKPHCHASEVITTANRATEAIVMMIAVREMAMTADTESGRPRGTSTAVVVVVVRKFTLHKIPRCHHSSSNSRSGRNNNNNRPHQGESHYLRRNSWVPVRQKADTMAVAATLTTDVAVVGIRCAIRNATGGREDILVVVLRGKMVVWEEVDMVMVNRDRVVTVGMAWGTIRGEGTGRESDVDEDVNETF